MLTKILTAGLMLVSTAALATPENPIIRKTNYAGYTMPQYGYSVVCDIFADRVVVERTFGRSEGESAGFSETRNVSLLGEYAATIAKAAAEPEETWTTPCDGPSDDLTAFRTLENGTLESVVLESSGGCGVDGRKRTGPATHVLKALAMSLCPAL